MKEEFIDLNIRRFVQVEVEHNIATMERAENGDLGW